MKATLPPIRTGDMHQPLQGPCPDQNHPQPQARMSHESLEKQLSSRTEQTHADPIDSSRQAQVAV